MVKINPNEIYNLYQIHTQELIPGVVTYRSIKSIVIRDSLGDRILDARFIKGSGNGQYEVKGSNIIKYNSLTHGKKGSPNNSKLHAR